MTLTSFDRRLRRALAMVAACVAVSVAPPAAAVADITVLDTTGDKPVPCPSIDASDPAKLRGGCVVQTGGGLMRLTVRSLVGDMEFVACEFGHRMRVDASGRTYMDQLNSLGKNPCNDVRACMVGNPRPWEGQLVADEQGRIEHVMDICFDSCMGQFQGEARLELSRDDYGDWRQRARGALMGSSGLQLDGAWHLQPGAVDIRTD